jgi:Leucine-rich repeat (LRR) protein
MFAIYSAIMYWIVIVLAFLVLDSTTVVMAVSSECYNASKYCELRDLQINVNNEIDVTGPFDWNSKTGWTRVVISESKFPHFPTNLFKLLPSLQSLSATNCGLLTLQTLGSKSPNISDSGKYLMHLDLSNNMVTFLEAHTFQLTSILETLSLSNNRLTYIDASAFSGLSKLDFLFLNNNQLTYLDLPVFTPLQSLTRLFSSNNLFQNFNFEWFSNNIQLEYVHLDGNKLSTLQATVVNNFTKYIELSGNQLENISALGKMKAMQELILSENNLTSLKNFPTLRYLKNLYVDGNKIKDLDVNALRAHFRKLKSINIGNNPWVCQVLTNVLDQLSAQKIR